ncbi:MAG: Holliday junction branch migration protein RuvA [bacterium]|nr:Holliday junction branch migration protein RuvA [bacterium]
MISYLKGKIKNKGNGFVILEINNIGYKVFVASLLYADLTVGQDFEFYIHQHVREDALNLYGFKQIEELELFELLIGISGIGPKSALGIMSIATASDIKESIVRGDPALLTKVSGIGRKTADRVVLELREKISKLSFKDNKLSQSGLGSSDEIDALMALGYSLSQAREALNGVDGKIKDSGERIRQALKKMGK